MNRLILIVTLFVLYLISPALPYSAAELTPYDMLETGGAGSHHERVLYVQDSQDDDSYMDDPFEEDSDYLAEGEELEQIADPLEPVNRVFFQFNDKLYFWVMKPVAEGYAALVPEGARVSVKHFFTNISAPVRVVNNLLQMKIKPAGKELMRFGINSTFGMLGLHDVAKSELDISAYDEDFGQTLGVWGVGPGIFINWPVLGPSNIRDTLGYAGDYFLDPLNYLKPSLDRTAIKATDGINRASLSIGDYEEIKKDAFDPYDAVKDIYYQYRKNKIDR